MDLPELTLGTWLTFSTAHQDIANALVTAAFDAGIDAFDTADVYGMGDGERALAVALRAVRLAHGAEVRTVGEAHPSVYSVVAGDAHVGWR